MKRASRFLSILLAVAMITALFAGCAKTADKPAEQKPAAEEKKTEPAPAPAKEEPKDPIKGKRIGVAHISKYDEWCAGVSDEFEKQGKALGFSEVNVQDGNLDLETQLKQIENFVAKGYDVIFVDPASEEGIAEILETKVHPKGIPVVAFDSPANWDKLVSYIAWDHAATGTMMGKYVVKYIQEKLGGKANIAILDMKQYPHTAIRAEKFKEELKVLGDNVKIVCNQDCQGNRETSANIIANVKEKIDIVFAVVDNGAWGAISALEAKNNTTTKVVSAGAYGKEPFDALKNNHPNYLACVAVPPANIVKDSLDAAVKYLKGEKDIPKKINIELAIYDASNISQYYK